MSVYNPHPNVLRNKVGLKACTKRIFQSFWWWSMLLGTAICSKRCPCWPNRSLPMLGGRFLFEDANLLFLGFGQEWRNFSYQNTATKVCSKPSQATKMQDAQRLHLAYHDFPKNNSLENPARSPTRNASQSKEPHLQRKRQAIHIHSQPLTKTYVRTCVPSNSLTYKAKGFI